MQIVYVDLTCRGSCCWESQARNVLLEWIRGCSGLPSERTLQAERADRHIWCWQLHVRAPTRPEAVALGAVLLA
jgi:hypothetical protein